MQPTTRLCRAEVEAEFGRPEMNRRQRMREERIVKTGTFLMARHGRNAITFRMLAGALRMSPTTLAWHYLDLDALLGEILRTYLQKLHSILGAVPHNVPNRQPLLRAAYLQAIQGPLGGLTQAHILLTRDRHCLPADELESIEPTIQGLGELLGGDLGPIALDLLDRPWMHPAMAETLLTAAATIQAEPETAEPPQPAETEPPPEAQPPERTIPFRRFELQDIPLPAPGSLAAMTDAELDAAERSLNRRATPPPGQRKRKVA